MCVGGGTGSGSGGRENEEGGRVDWAEREPGGGTQEQMALQMMGVHICVDQHLPSAYLGCILGHFAEGAGWG